tara:strand:- start:40 stop:1281 length:1242 start_codon:yes stop_codon:yes gene_type:complete
MSATGTTKMVAAKYKTMTKQLQKEKKELVATNTRLSLAKTELKQRTDKQLKDKNDLLKDAEEEKKEIALSLKEALDETAQVKQVQEQAEEFISEMCDITGEQDPDAIKEWAYQQKRDKDAVRMFGELQIEHNLLKEKLADIHLNGHKVSKSKSKKGLSGTHRAEDIQNGVLRCFQEDRCCAIAWAEGKGQQCSRHWDKHEDGKTSKLCKTHHKLLKHDGTYEGAFGLYQKQRPTKWGECGLTFQREYKKDGKINWKMSELDYDRQFATDEFQQSIPSDLPKYLFPDEDAPQTSSDEEMEVSDDETDDEENVSADDEVSSDEEEEVCDDCGKCLEGDNKCGEGCPAYDAGLEDVTNEDEMGGPYPAPLLSEESEDEMGEMVDEQAELEAEIEANGCAESDDESECEVVSDDESE